ncbi:MAG: rRNA maturation RNase YbeY [Clostridia bacterium]|nr:rRNA maturation RNase YbeY [Clostridia bacterium]
MVDITYQCEGVPDALSAVVEAAIEAALDRHAAVGQVSVLFMDDGGIRRLNCEYRGKDTPTDVLSFPAAEGGDLPSLPDAFLGDIAISYDRVLAQAEEYGHSIERETAFLAVHGCLHLLGYDHMTAQDESRMFGVQREILDKLGVLR